MRRYLHYFLDTCGFLLSFISLALPKIGALACSALVFANLDITIWTILLSVLVFFISASLIFPVSKFFIEKGLLLSEFSRKYEKSYIKQYGENFKRPAIEDFGLTTEEYTSYNRRFVIDQNFFSLMTFPIALILLSHYISGKGTSIFILIIVVAGTISILIRLLIKYLNSHLAKKWSQFSKMEAYKKSYYIYKSIQEEIRKNKESAKYWKN